MEAEAPLDVWLERKLAPYVVPAMGRLILAYVNPSTSQQRVQRLLQWASSERKTPQNDKWGDAVRSLGKCLLSGERVAYQLTVLYCLAFDVRMPTRTFADSRYTQILCTSCGWIVWERRRPAMCTGCYEGDYDAPKRTKQPMLSRPRTSLAFQTLLKDNATHLQIDATDIYTALRRKSR